MTPDKHARTRFRYLVKQIEAMAGRKLTQEELTSVMKHAIAGRTFEDLCDMADYERKRKKEEGYESI